jgi:adenosylcobyric acid synthase
VNKFRGDRSLFTDGVRILERRARVPVFGVLPYRDDLGVAAEDSLSLDGGGRAAASGAPDIAVIRYPQISNFDDFEPLARAGASVRFVVDARDLGDPDLVVLPGSKATLRDLAWLRATGIAARVRAVAGAGVPVLGICGGYQMLGEVVADPDGIEGERARVRGLGLLPARTVLQRDKRTVPVSGRLCAGWALGGDIGPALTGYEIHLGVTEVEGVRPFAEIVRSPSGERVTDGAVSADGRTAGTYVHGLFASEPLRVALLEALAERRGISFAPRSLPADPYAALSAWFREAVDVPRLLAACGIA